MKTLSIRLTNEEYKSLQKYALMKNLSLSKALKGAFFEKLEDEYDIKAFDNAYVKFKNNQKTYSTDEVRKKITITE